MGEVGSSNRIEGWNQLELFISSPQNIIMDKAYVSILQNSPKDQKKGYAF